MNRFTVTYSMTTGRQYQGVLDIVAETVEEAGKQVIIQMANNTTVMVRRPGSRGVTFLATQYITETEVALTNE